MCVYGGLLSHTILYLNQLYLLSYIAHKLIYEEINRRNKLHYTT